MAVPQKNLALVLASLSTLVQNSVFKLQKGARQGDQISAYLFILALEILFYLIKTNKKNRRFKHWRLFLSAFSLRR